MMMNAKKEKFSFRTPGRANYRSPHNYNPTANPPESYYVLYHSFFAPQITFSSALMLDTLTEVFVRV